jgi:hypothetical protein
MENHKINSTPNLTFMHPCIIVQFIKENPTRWKNVSKFYYSIFIWSSTCFGRHPDNVQTTFLEWKTRDCHCSFRLLTMGGVLPVTCWASYKYGIIKFWYIVAYCWIFFMNYELHQLCMESVCNFTWIQPSNALMAWKVFISSEKGRNWHTLLYCMYHQ